MSDVLLAVTVYETDRRDNIVESTRQELQGENALQVAVDMKRKDSSIMCFIEASADVVEQVQSALQPTGLALYKTASKRGNQYLLGMQKRPEAVKSRVSLALK